MKFTVVPRSAVYGHQPGEYEVPRAGGWPRAGLRASPDQLRAGRGPSAVFPDMPRDHQVELLNGEIQRLRAQNKALVQTANARMGAMAKQIQHLSGLVRGRAVNTAYAPGPQTPGKAPYDVGVPTHAMRNPNVAYVDGARGAPPAVVQHDHAGNPRDAAGNPHDAARDVNETVRNAEDAIFYGDGDAAFYQGEGD